MKVLHVQPPHFGKPGFNKIAPVGTLGLEMVADALLAEHEVRIDDMRPEDRIRQGVGAHAPAFIDAHAPDDKGRPRIRRWQ